ncbi:MAG: hypothetical protein R6W90_16420 [Ignavibacteriaceae bacterium]
MKNILSYERKRDAVPDISKQILYEIQKEARHYIASVKGQNYTADDLVVAENLIVFGYLKAIEDIESNSKVTKAMKENTAVINSEWR